ncbi:MAG: histidine--tRNA ligase [Zetaproteobacteria bacterium]|nr:MAG: histidine--tRNA ligase [Zetaproteobacteria bacterium]
MRYRTIRGVHDGLPGDVARWRCVEQAARTLFSRYCFQEVRLPVLEQAALFTRSVGEATDIVAKEMYRFTDRGGEEICLRPEGTAGAVRAFLQAGLGRSGEQRWFYIGPMFRRERPQKGRLRQFQQIGVEWFGPAGPIADIELLTMAWGLIETLGIDGARLELNSLGCPSCRPCYRETLVGWLRARRDALCATCRTRVDTNPMRVLDCKEPDCRQALRDAPVMVEHLCDACDDHFRAVTAGLAVPYAINPHIVRGLDYYSRTAFEIVTDRLGAQGTVIAGGRYDHLVAELGGAPTPAIGFALGLERIALLLDPIEVERAQVAVVALGEEARIPSIRAAERLRAAGISTIHCGGGSGKRQFRMADRERVAAALILGTDELARGLWSVRDMRDGSQQTLTPEEAIARLRDS